MNNLLDISLLEANILKLWSMLKMYIDDSHFWLQLTVIASVFLVARWLVTPLLHKFLSYLSKSCTRVPSFRTPINAIDSVANTIAWLLLQWVAIGVADYLKWPSGALTVIASLLTAWILIRLATKLVANESLAHVIALTAWTVAALNIFQLLDPLIHLLDSWAVTIGQVRLSPVSLIKIGFSLWFSLWLANGLATLFERKLEGIQTVAPTMRVLGGKLARITLITIAALIALSVVGIDLTALAVFSGALGVGLGFGLQKIFSNLVSGLILLMDKSIKPGDVIAVNGTFGWINHLGARYASVITRDGIEHIIPNEELITQRVENWSYSNNLVRLKIPIGISYRSDPRKAMALCVEAAQMVPRVKRDPEPRVQLVGFGGSSVDLELRIWIDDPPQGRANVISEALLNVWDLFQKHNIEIPFAQQDLHVRTVLGEEDLSSVSAKLKPGNNTES